VDQVRISPGGRKQGEILHHRGGRGKRLAPKQTQETTPSNGGLRTEVQLSEIHPQRCLNALREVPTVRTPLGPLQNALNLQILREPTPHQGPHVRLPILHRGKRETMLAHHEEVRKLRRNIPLYPGQTLPNKDQGPQSHNCRERQSTGRAGQPHPP